MRTARKKRKHFSFFCRRVVRLKCHISERENEFEINMTEIRKRNKYRIRFEEANMLIQFRLNSLILLLAYAREMHQNQLCINNMHENMNRQRVTTIETGEESSDLSLDYLHDCCCGCGCCWNTLIEANDIEMENDRPVHCASDSQTHTSCECM